MKLILKNVLIAAFTFIASSIAASGIPATQIAWEVLGLTTLGTLVTYTIQSINLPTTSIGGNWDLRDLLKGGILAVGNSLSLMGASSFTGTKLDVLMIVKSAGFVFFSYIMKQFATKPKLA